MTRTALDTAYAAQNAAVIAVARCSAGFLGRGLAALVAAIETDPRNVEALRIVLAADRDHGPLTLAPRDVLLSALLRLGAIASAVREVEIDAAADPSDDDGYFADRVAEIEANRDFALACVAELAALAAA